MALTQIQAGSIEPGAIDTAQLGANVTATYATYAAVAANLTPRITTVNVANSSYTVLDDVAVNTSGGYLVITGANFQSGAIVTIQDTNATSTTYVNDTTLRAQVPAKTAGSYNLYVTNPDGGTAIKVLGVSYSNTPVWGTAATLSNQNSESAFGLLISANSDSNITYSNTTALPAGTTLLSNGWFYGTITVAEQTTYTFTVIANDAENQDTPREFSLTVTAGGWNIAANTLSQTTNSFGGMDGFGSFYFSSDGTKLIYNNSASNLRTMTLGSSLNLASAFTYTRDFSTPSSGSSGLYFNSDGTKMYLTDYGTKLVYYYTLSTAWDTSSASQVSTYNVQSRQNFPFAVWVSADGTKMYVGGNGSGQKGVQRFTLSTPWDPSSATFVSSYDPGDASTFRKFSLKPDGTKLYLSYSDSSDTAFIKQYSLSTAWDITSASLEATLTTYSNSMTGSGFYPGRTGIWFSSNGKTMILGGSEGTILSKYTLS